MVNPQAVFRLRIFFAYVSGDVNYDSSFAPYFTVKLSMGLKSNKIFKGKIIAPKLLGSHPIGNIELKAQGKWR